MKIRILLIVLLFMSFTLGAWTQNFSFTYDVNGNRTNRVIPLKSTLSASDSTDYDSSNEEFNEQIENSEIFLFPNPTKGNIFLNIKNLSPGLSSGLDLFDNAGRLLNKIEILTEHNTIDLSYLPPGNYFIKIRIGDCTSDWKIIKE